MCYKGSMQKTWDRIQVTFILEETKSVKYYIEYKLVILQKKMLKNY